MCVLFNSGVNYGSVVMRQSRKAETLVINISQQTHV